MNIKQEIMKKYHKMAKFYDLRPIFDFLELLRKSGIVNMFGASPFLYAGKQFIKDEVKRKNDNLRWWSDSEEDEENDDEEFDSEQEEIYQKLIDMADDTRNRMIQGAMRSIENQDDENFIRSVQRKIQKDATDIVMIWGNFKGKVINEWEEKPGLWSSIKRGVNNNDIKNYLFRRVPLDVFKTIVNDNLKFGIKEYDGHYTLYEFHNGVVNIIIEDLINYDYIGEIVDAFDVPLKEKTYNDLHQFLYDMLFETSEKAYAEAVRQFEEEYGDEIDEE